MSLLRGQAIPACRRVAPRRSSTRRGTARELTRRVYGPEVGEELIEAAEMTMRAHLDKLVDDGKVRVEAAGEENVYERSG